MGRKITSLILCGALLSGIFAGSKLTDAETMSPTENSVMAEVSINSNATADTKDVSNDKLLETAIKVAKAKIDIPKDYSDFNYYYYDSNNYTQVYWSLNWRRPKDNSFIEVNLDKDNNIIYYLKYDSSKSFKSVPSYLKEELLDKAENFIKKIAPDIYLSMEYEESHYDGVYNNTYSYIFHRKEKGIMLPENTVTVSVDASTGEVKSAYIDWLYDAKIPASDVKITKEEAAKIIGENLKMKLSYKINYNWIYENGQSRQVKKAFLVYEPDIPYISVDAKTGKVYLTKNEWVELINDRNKYDIANNKEATADAGDNSVLTEEEIAKIKELNNLITKEKAIETVTTNPYLYIDKNLLTYTATLRKSYNSGKESSYVWNIELRDDRPIDYEKEQDSYRAYAYATVDAKTGKILSFSASIKDNYDSKTGKWLPVKVKYDAKYGQNVFEKFLKGEINDLFKKTKLVSQKEDYVAYYSDNNEPVYGGYYYTYNRINEDVEFPYNGIYGAVDGVSGKIYSYYYRWDYDITFESPKNAISSKEAFDHYISKDGFNLIYEINAINQYDPDYNKNFDSYKAYSVNYEIRLVYRPDISPSYISPFTGEQLDYDGEVYKVTHAYVYDDINDAVKDREILLLADMGIGFNDKNFNPDKAVTEGEVVRLFEDLGYYDEDSENLKGSSKLITREEMAYTLVRRLGLEKVAKLYGIYNTGYYDDYNINSSYTGAVAIAKGLKLFPDYNNDSFNPKNNVTRRELAHIIFNYIKADNDLRYN